jgi:hypothetical protein
MRLSLRARRMEGMKFLSKRPDTRTPSVKGIRATAQHWAVTRGCPKNPQQFNRNEKT